MNIGVDIIGLQNLARLLSLFHSSFNPDWQLLLFLLRMEGRALRPDSIGKELRLVDENASEVPLVQAVLVVVVGDLGPLLAQLLQLLVEVQRHVRNPLVLGLHCVHLLLDLG